MPDQLIITLVFAFVGALLELLAANTIYPWMDDLKSRLVMCAFGFVAWGFAGALLSFLILLDC